MTNCVCCSGLGIMARLAEACLMTSRSCSTRGDSSSQPTPACCSPAGLSQATDNCISKERRNVYFWEGASCRGAHDPPGCSRKQQPFPAALYIRGLYHQVPLDHGCLRWHDMCSLVCCQSCQACPGKKDTAHALIFQR